jgi:hypothetical protein
MFDFLFANAQDVPATDIQDLDSAASDFLNLSQVQAADSWDVEVISLQNGVNVSMPSIGDVLSNFSNSVVTLSAVVEPYISNSTALGVSMLNQLTTYINSTTDVFNNTYTQFYNLNTITKEEGASLASFLSSWNETCTHYKIDCSVAMEEWVYSQYNSISYLVTNITNPVIANSTESNSTSSS